jgi:hypothetical protein
MGRMSRKTEDNFLLFAELSNLTSYMRSMTVKKKYPPLPIFGLRSLWFKDFLKLFQAEFIICPSLFRYRDLSNKEALVPILEEDPSIKNNEGTEYSSI